MERFLLYLDDLDDFFYAVALAGERLRRVLRTFGIVAAAATVETLFIHLALRDPALGAAFAALLMVAVLYRLTTAPAGPGLRRA